MPRLLFPDQKLSGAQYLELHRAILDAYGFFEFEQMMQFRLGRRLDQLSSPLRNLPDRVFDVIRHAEDGSWTAELLQAARASRPDNAMLLGFAQEFGLAAASPQLELKIKHRIPMLDVVQWREGLGKAEAQVCRIERTTGTTVDAIGTGFLLGPDVVMTNFHVMQPVIEGHLSPDRIGLRFDFEALADGVTVHPGRQYALATSEAWDLDHSTHSPCDVQVDPTSLPEPNQLDYALVRVAGSPGNDPISYGKGAEAGAPPRHWIKAPEGEHDFLPNSPVCILQHPDGGPLKLAIDTESVSALNANKTRVRYTTNTEPGSSGSPCFDVNWNLIALHQSGDPKYHLHFKKAEYNQGIPFSLIVRLLEQRGKKQLLG